MNRAAEISTLEKSLAHACAEALRGFNGHDQSVYQMYQAIDPQAQREADLLEFGEDDIKSKALRDWCQPAKLKRMFGSSGAGVDFLHENDPLCGADQDIDAAIHAAIYLSETQEANRHDRILVDVPKNGRRKGGTHGLPPELRRTRSAKIANEQLLRNDAPELECLEGTAFYRATNARIVRNRAYVISVYNGRKHADVLALRLLGKSTSEIAKALGKTDRYIRYIINGNVGRGQPGLHQIVEEILTEGVPKDFKSNHRYWWPSPITARKNSWCVVLRLPVLQLQQMEQAQTPPPVIVQPVHNTLRKRLQKQAVLGQLAWDFEGMEVAA